MLPESYMVTHAGQPVEIVTNLCGTFWRFVPIHTATKFPDEITAATRATKAGIKSFKVCKESDL